MLSIRGIIRWEALSGRSFYLLDSESEEDIRMLGYAVSGSTQPYDEWSGYVGAHFFETLSAELACWEQYIPKSEGSAPSSGGDDIEPVRIGDIVADLIVSGGVDAKWVYDEMTFLELHHLQGALERRMRYSLEDSRLWCFLGLLPHVKSGTLKEPKDLYPFPWEQAVGRGEPFMNDEDIEARIREIEEAYK